MGTETRLPIDDDELVAAFLDVGQGDATVVRLPGRGQGGAVLVDCAAGAAWIVLEYMERVQVRSLEVVVVTHSDLDHAGNVMDVIKNFTGTTSRIAYNLDRGPGSDPSEGKRYRLLLQDLATQIRKRGIRPLDATADLVLNLEAVSIEVLHPAKVDITEAVARGLTNDASAVVRFEYQGRRLLLGADVQGRGWQWMRERGVDLAADVFKVPHHGAWYADGLGLEEVIDLVNPRYVVVSVGTTNVHDHPSLEALKLLRGRYPALRFVCTQATARCHPDVASIASHARSLVAPICGGGHSATSPRSCPCAGTVLVGISAHRLWMLPTEEQHALLIQLFASPQCTVPATKT